MIIIKNREMLIPDDERNIGTTYDTESEFRSFRVPRFSQSGVDLSSHTFRLDLKYANDAYDTVVLTKDVSDNQIVLTWEITSSQLQVPGTLYIAIRAVDNEATVKWSTYTATMFVERHLNTPGNYTGDLTEIEQMEQDHQYMKGVVDELKGHLDYRSDAEAWAVGQRLGEDVESTDPTYHNNSKYYSEQAANKASAASESATAAASSATQAASTVADTNTRFDNALRAVTTDTELADIRVKADGTTASSAGNAVREQVTDLNDALKYVENSLFQKSFTSNYIAIPTNWKTGQGINSNDGSNFTNSKYCRTGYVHLDYPAIYIELIDSTYEFAVWEYSSDSVSSATYSPKSKYSSDDAILLKKDSSVYFRISARRKDLAVLQSSDVTAIAASLKTYSIAYESKSVKKVACFGDSIMWGRDGSGSSSSRVADTLPKILSEKCGITFDNYGVGGMGYLRPDDADNKIAYDKISETDLSTYDAVLMCFGVNDGIYPIGDYDSDDLTTVMGQFNRIINYIYTHYQNKLIFVVAPFNGRNVGTFPDYWYGTHFPSNRQSRLILSNSIKHVCEDYSIPYIEQFDSPINAFTITDALPDGVHPSSAYYKKIGHWLAGKLCTLIG